MGSIIPHGTNHNYFGEDIPYVPADIVLKITSYLSTKECCVLLCVNKTWNNFLGSEEFLGPVSRSLEERSNRIKTFIYETFVPSIISNQLSNELDQPIVVKNLCDVRKFKLKEFRILNILSEIKLEELDQIVSAGNYISFHIKFVVGAKVLALSKDPKTFSESLKLAKDHCLWNLAYRIIENENAKDVDETLFLISKNMVYRNFNKGLSAAQNIQSADLKAKAFEYCSLYLVRRERLQEAEDLALTIPKEKEKSQVYKAICMKKIEKGEMPSSHLLVPLQSVDQLEVLLKIIEKFDCESSQKKVLKVIDVEIELRLTNGQIKEAKSFAKHLPKPYMEYAFALIATRVKANAPQDSKQGINHHPLLLSNSQRRPISNECTIL